MQGRAGVGHEEEGSVVKKAEEEKTYRQSGAQRKATSGCTSRPSWAAPP